MKFKELFTENGIFQIFKTAFPTDFAELFTETAVSNLDNFCLLKYGDKECISSLTLETAETAVISVIAINLENWQKLKNAYSAQYDATINSAETHTKTGTIERQNTGNETRLNAEKVFNDVDFTDNERTGTQNTANGKEIFDVTEKISSSGGNISDNVRKEIYLRREFNLLAYISQNIVNEITLSIY